MRRAAALVAPLALAAALGAATARGETPPLPVEEDFARAFAAAKAKSALLLVEVWAPW